jgi:hypothetical protein
VLYDQSNNAGAQSTNSQNFETANDPFDNTAADDFVVPAGQTWNVSQVRAPGVYFNGTGPAASFNVTVYPDASGFPGASPACTRSAAAYTNASGVFSITMSPACALPAGTYWVSIQANMDFPVGGQWGWTDRTIQSNSAAAWRNPGGGFAVPNCTANWGRRGGTTASGGCNIDPGVPDQMFQIVGSTGAGCASPSPGPSVTPTVVASPSPSCNPGYAFTSSTGAAIVPGTTDTGNHTDDGTTPITLPFSYNLYGTSSTSANVDSNGTLAFASTTSTFSNVCLPSTAYNQVIMPHWDDLRTDQTSAGCAGYPGGQCGIFTSVSGAAPNRIFNIEWRAVYFDTPASRANFELRLYEGQTRFDIIYGELTDAGASATIGVQRDTGSQFTQFSCSTGGITSGRQLTAVLGSCGTPNPSPTVNPTPSPTGSPQPLTFCNTAPIDMTLNGPAAPYPSNVTVAGAPGRSGGIRVTLNGLYHTFPDNIDVLLVGPGGQRFVLMGDAGGPIAIPQNAPVTLTFADFVPNVLPNNGPLTTGTYMPTNWETPVNNFPAPAPPGPYVEPGNQPFPPIGRTMFGTFGLTNPNGVWSLYVRDDGGNPLVVVGSISGGWCLTILPPTAAGVSISGRVTTAEGNGIRNARVVVTGNSLPEPRVVTTGSFGIFSVDGLTAGETYVVTVNSQRYTFSAPSRVYSLVDNVVDADFVANEQ